MNSKSTSKIIVYDCWAVAVRAALVMWLLVFLAIACCHSVKTKLPALIAAAHETSIEDAMAPLVSPRALASRARAVDDLPWLEVPTGPGPGGTTGGNVREIHGRTACQSSIPLPCIVFQDDPPRVGVDWACTFATSSCAPFPDWDCWLLVSHQPGESIDFTPYGMPGCWLHVSLDQLISVPIGYGGSPMLTRHGGQIVMHYTPPPIMAGRTFWMQLLTRAPTGFVSSHAIEVLVGN
jgi:hypothetical protein